MKHETKSAATLTIKESLYTISDGISKGRGNCPASAYAAFKEDKAFNQAKYITQINQDMYKALKDILDTLKTLGVSVDKMEFAQKALAKAEGKL